MEIIPPVTSAGVENSGHDGSSVTGILSALRSGKFQCYGPAGVAGDGDDHPVAREETAPGPPRGKFIETPRPSEPFIPVPQVAADDPLLFRFFIDGSERVTAAGFVIDPKKRYLPLLIAQVAVATTELQAACLTIKHYDSRNTFFFPDSFAEEDLAEAKRVVCAAAKSSRLPLDLDFDKYQVDEDKTPMDRARAKVLQKMHYMEIQRIADLARGGEISRDSLLLIDGSIEFYSDMDRHQEAFRNVVGVAKSFDLHRRYHSKGKDAERVGALISRLQPKKRTPALGTQHRNLTIASWYLRLQGGHRRIPGLDPQDGVIKIEVFPDAPGDDTPTIDAARCDRLSKHILALRAPATPNTDARWASNLYPVYLTERYIKTRFRSHHSIRACL